MASGVGRGALGDLAATVDTARFVGRDELLDKIDRIATGRSPARLVHLHGPGGVGKSATLRAAARRAAQRGQPVLSIDGRLVPPVPDALAAALGEGPGGPAGTLVLIDEVDELAPLRVELRRWVLEELPADSAVVTAGRRPPGAEWFEHGLDHLTAVEALRPLDVTTSRQLLERAGMTDPDAVTGIVTWAQGYPLALALAADLQARPGRHRLEERPAPPGDRLDDRLLARLGGDELQGVDPDVLDVAAIAPAVDARLLRAVLPGRSTRAGLAALRTCRLSEPIGPRVALHRLAREALRSRLRETDPDRYRTLVLRVADHLRSRADVEGGRVLPELATLIENPEVRLSFDPSTTHYADRSRPGDVEVLAAATGQGDTGWFRRLARWAEERPQQVVAVRRVTGELASAAVSYTAASLPAWAEETVEVGPVVAHARAHGHLDRALFLQDVTTIESPDDPAVTAEIVRVGNVGTILFSGMLSPRYAYVTSRPDDVAPLASVGYVEVPELRRHDADRELVTIVCDFGPAGMVGRAHDLVRAEQQADPVPGGGERAWLVAALRAFHDDDALAVAAGRPAEEARRAVVAALDDAFDDGPADRDLRRALERTYLDRDGGHGVAQRELFMSRSSFYRHLQRARHQLVERAGPTGP